MAQRVTRTDAANNLQKVAEGRLNSENFESNHPPSSTFIRMIVMEVVTDPNADLVDQNKINSWHAMGVSNMQYATIAPRNTIIAKKVGEETDPMFVFPFFPSHLSLPCKPGECVWAMVEKPDIPGTDIAFWFARVVEPHISDDVNHSHPGRSFESSLSPSTKERMENDQKENGEIGKSVFHELRNGPVVKKGDARVTAGEGNILLGEEEDIFERLLISSKASEFISYEAVPRFRKRPGDIALEGTNNTLVVLGTDRSGSINMSDFSAAAGSIDIVAGRGQTKDTFGTVASTTTINKTQKQEKGEELKRELNKSLDVISRSEGDPDFKNDRSRVLISQRTSVDKNFSISDYNKNFDVEDSNDGDAGIVIKSDKIRLIARSDVEIMVMGFNDIKSPDDKNIKDQESDNDKWASIVINSKGEIIIKPSKTGVIKLGSEKADKAIFCTKSPNAGAGGTVIGKPVATTMGGQVGLPGDNSPTGEWAKKVLID